MRKLNYYKSRIVKHTRALVWYLISYAGFKRVLKQHGIHKIKPILFLKWHHGSHYFLGSTIKDNEKEVEVFIKTGGDNKLITKEVNALKYVKNNRTDQSAWSVPNLVTFLDKDEFAFIAIEYIRGETLTSVISQDRLTNPNMYELINQFNQICDFLYSHNLIHRDIRPDNILVCFEKQSIKVVLLDFAYLVSNSKLEFSETDSNDLKKHLYGLGAGLNPEPLVWDDAYSLYKIVKQLKVSIDSDLNELLKLKIGRLVYRIDKIN